VRLHTYGRSFGPHSDANLVATTVVFYVAARIYLLPHLGRLRPSAVLIPILLLHSLRHLGLMFLTRGRLIQDCRHSLLIRPLWATCFLPCLLLPLSFWSLEIRLAPDLWSGSLTSSAQSICWCDHSGDSLPSPCIYGAGLLDSRVLGSFLAGYTLHYVPYPYQTLER